MKTKLEEIIYECTKDAKNHNCIDCLCNEGECLEALLDIYNSKKGRDINE